MSRNGLRRLGGLLSPAVLVVLGCGRVVADGGSEWDATGSESTGDGGGTSGSTADEGDDTGTSSTTGTDTGTTGPGCGVVDLADVARGIGGFAIDGEAEGDESGEPVRAAGDVNGDGLADVIVGAPGSFTSERSGRAYVVFGKADTDKVLLAHVSQGIGGFVLQHLLEWADRLDPPPPCDPE